MHKFKVVIFILLSSFTLANAEDYVFGDGLQIADSPITLGGYISSIYTINKNERHLNIDDAALLVYGEYDHYDFLAEFEVADVYKKDTGIYRDEGSSTKINTERLYGDYFFGNNERLRFGKFTSDIGFWNQLPINVLRDTTSSPRLVTEFFPKLTTGINYEVRPASSIIHRVSITIQNNHDIDTDYNNFTLDRNYAIACDIKNDNALWRFGTGYFRYAPMYEAMYLFGALKVEQKQWDFLLESILREDKHDNKYSYDAYAQGVWHVIPKHDAILRAEIEKTPLTRMQNNSLLVGYTYRPLSNVALKVDYEAHNETLLNRWLFSFSVLF
ncbi:MAG: hypothetical protein PHO27_10290 [Sulfuricurvum sp.]|nr:hypothetical protein [Sulfuricurvum sp.]